MKADFDSAKNEIWKPIAIGFQAAIIGPLLYPKDSDMGRKNPRRVAPYAPNNHHETMLQVVESCERGATSVHIHPIQEGTGIHTKTPELYERNAAGARREVPGIIVNNDASLNGVNLSSDATREDYLKTRLAGLMNDSPPNVFTLFATNEAKMVADTPGGYPRSYVEDFIRIAGRKLQEKGITALAEISQDPYGMRSVRRGLEILRQNGTQLPALSFSFLVNGTAMLPAFSDKPLKQVDADGNVHEETAKDRLMRLLDEAVGIKHEFNLRGPLTFGTVVPVKLNEQHGTIQHEVWDWIAEYAATHPGEAREFGIVVKAGLEEWSHYQGRPVSNPESISIARAYMEDKKTPQGAPLFKTATDVNTMRGWVLG